ncbi:MAG: NAD(P)/FAD-dependent oxidoreductase [Chloroflexi bacterium]|nr:NAD(P)/FAD-dependent oxidoreductase [Chloroflexota bacterium]
MHVDVTIIGAGVVGLGIAAQLSGKGRQVLLLEKNTTFGQETSSRNSGVIHAGMYYPEGSLKARLCVEGNHTLYELCQRYAIPYKNLGKLVVARDSREVVQLQALYQRGQRNGVSGLSLLSRDELKRLEPNVEGVAALLSATTGIVDAHALMRFFLGRARENGVMVAYCSEAIAIVPAPQGYQVTVRDSDGLTSFNTAVVVNSAGLNAHKVAELAGIDLAQANYRVHYCKGEYFRVGRRGLVSRLVYPVPEPSLTGLGIHMTLDLEGETRLGPDTRYVDAVDYKVDDSQKAAFYQSARNLVPQLQLDDLSPDFAGIRPKLQGPGESFRDFVIKNEVDRGLPALVNLIGIESPGLTASPAIARYVENIVLPCL